MDLNQFAKFYSSHKGGVIGAAIGILVAVLILWLGFFNMLFIAILGGIGYYIGVALFQGKNFIRELIDRIIPPGTYR